MIKYALGLSLRLHALFDVVVSERNLWLDYTERTDLARRSSLRFECFTGSKTVAEDPKRKARVQIGNLNDILSHYIIIYVKSFVDTWRSVRTVLFTRSFQRDFTLSGRMLLNCSTCPLPCGW